MSFCYFTVSPDTAKLLLEQKESITQCVPTAVISLTVSDTDENKTLVLEAADDEHVSIAKKLISHLIPIADDKLTLNYGVVMDTWESIAYSKKRISPRTIVKRHGSGEPVKAKTLGQEKYVRAIENHLITFGIGAAGTGKTFLAIAAACRSLKNRDIDKIILTRPVVEAGENLGFLPGDMQEKIDPYMQPLYDSLYDILGKPAVDGHLQKGTIRIAPLAYMRGCTFTNAFIILDEAQNATQEQLHMFLTRFGEHSRMVVECDPSQIDLPKKNLSCVSDISLFENIPDIAICRLTENDVTRHPIIKKINNAYAKKK